MNRDSQTRMTNDQIRRNDQIQMTKPATAQLRAIGHSGFGFLSSLVIGPSSFNGLCKSGSWSQCTVKKASGLSMNRPAPDPSQEGSGSDILSDATCPCKEAVDDRLILAEP